MFRDTFQDPPKSSAFEKRESWYKFHHEYSITMVAYVVIYTKIKPLKLKIISSLFKDIHEVYCDARRP